MGRQNIFMTFACTTCGYVHAGREQGYAVADINKPVCADIGQEEDRQCFNRVNKILLLHPAELEAITRMVEERHGEIEYWVSMCKQPPERKGLKRAEAALVVSTLAVEALKRNKADG